MFEKDTLIFMQKDLCNQWNRISCEGTVKEEDLTQSKDNFNKAMVHSLLLSCIYIDNAKGYNSFQMQEINLL